MTREQIEKGIKCCDEFLCGECPYEQYDDKIHHEYDIRCMHMLMHDINSLYFKNIDKLIDKAYKKYPVGIYYRGRLTEEEIEKIEQFCDVKCSSVYMDGSAIYRIRKKDSNDEERYDFV